MQFTVEQIRSVRNNYLEPPYPGFSLDEVVRRRRLTQTKLVRGENAWVAKGTAQTTEEWVQRLLHGTLNKLTEENKDIMIDKLLTKELFATEDIMNMVVNIIFKKALDEPENSKLYAGVCHSLALYEANVLRDGHKGERPQSQLRDAIISTVQHEFRTLSKELSKMEDKSEEELEYEWSNVMRRKRSNMRFIGELYLCTALTHSTMFTVMDLTMRCSDKTGFPSSENIELLAALLNTIGDRLDQNHKKTLDRYFTSLENFNKKPDCPYPPRIRFKIMDLLDLRKRGWGSKPKPVKAALPPSHGKDKKCATAPPPKKGGRDQGSAAAASKSWRDAATMKTGTAAAPASSTGKGLNGRGMSSASPAANTTALSTSAAVTVTATAPAGASFRDEASPQVPLVKFELRVASMFQEWVADRTNDVILHWVDQFNTCDRFFESESELCVAVAQEVIHSACTTTRKDAQREAFSFLVVGLYMIDTEVFDGFASALASAIEDGLLEDVPKFGERFMSMLRLTSTEQETRADVYFDAANVLRLTYNRLESPDDSAVDTLMSFWDRVPLPSTDEENMIRMDLDVVYSLCNPEGAQDGLEKLLSRIIHSMLQMQLMDAEVLDEFLCLDVQEGVCAKVIADYKERFPK
ncbi:eukaryotic translation initiation factor 4 gamma, putative [Leishmania donovani]|uniref:Eukaryotic translation initiation factor 4 gamma, putative n=1 Tax=Leishmania donovani TaxID=5661 RepID=A0A3Q8IAL0_LEIDO|nr:eukaryotic translation initiation factor 4 gamma, putative [Leishmania donovani]